MIRTSEQINEISEALAKAQGKFGAAIKGSQNPAFRSKYADLSAVIDATLEHLNAEGIVAMQHPALVFEERGEERLAMVTVTTRLQHKSGQWIESDLSVPAVQRERFDAQSVGSGITYACRYALQSICLVPREDDDGNAATGTGTREAAQAVADKKIKEMKAKQPPADCLFYTFPEAHNGHFAEFINMKAYGEGLNQVAIEGLKQVFKPFIAKVTKDETVLVANAKMDALLAELEKCEVKVHLLKAAQ